MDYEFSSQSLIERQALPNPFTALREELRLAVLLEPNTPTLRRLFLATLILIPLGIFIWMLGLVIRWWKDVDWYWKWEAGKFFRLNVYLFIPVGCSIFSAFFWVLVLGYYKIDGVSRADYFPYFYTFHGLVNFPILITGILAAHNALLSAPAAYYATQANAASTNGAQPKRAQSRFPYNINAQLFQWTLVTTVSIGLVPLFVISVFFGIWRERLLDTYVQLDDMLAIAESGGLFDLRDLAALESELKFQGNKTLRYGQAISIIHTIYCSLLLVPYLISITRLFNILRFQWKHLQMALQRLEQLDDNQRKTAGIVPIPLQAPKMSFNSSSGTGSGPSSDGSSSYPPTVIVPPKKRPRTAEDIESRIMPILDTFSPKVTNFAGDIVTAWGGSKVWADQGKEVRYRIYTLKRVFAGFWVLHCLTLVAILSFLMLACWLTIASYTGNLSAKTERTIDVAIVLAGFGIPQIIAGIYIIFDTWVILPIMNYSPDQTRPLSRQGTLPATEADSEMSITKDSFSTGGVHSPRRKSWFRVQSQSHARGDIIESIPDEHTSKGHYTTHAVNISLDPNGKEKEDEEPRQLFRHPRPSQWRGPEGGGGGAGRYSEDGYR